MIHMNGWSLLVLLLRGEDEDKAGLAFVNLTVLIDGGRRNPDDKM